MTDIILIHPPVTKPCEPPPGIARLAGALQTAHFNYKIIDSNLEGLLYLLNVPIQTPNPSFQQALQKRTQNIAAIRKIETFQRIEYYNRVVKELNRLLNAIPPSNSAIGLANFTHLTRVPTRSDDLIWAFEHPEDNPFYPYLKTKFLPVLEQDCPKVIGLSLSYLNQALTTFALIGFIKRYYPGIKIIVGGGLMTSWMRKKNWNDPFKGIIDLCVDGPGEQRLLSYLNSETRTVFYKPDFHSVSSLPYLSPGMVLPFNTSHGCYWNQCGFCPEPSEYKSFISLNPSEANSQLHQLSKEYNPILIHLSDNAISPAMLEKCSRNPLPCPWYGYVRFEKLLEDLDFCHSLKKSGCVMLKLGLESGNQGVLDYMNKGIQLSGTSRILENLDKAGIRTFVYLLFGTPAEGYVQARDTLEFVARHAQYIDFLNLAIFNLPVQSKEAGKWQTNDFYDGDLTLYTNFIHPKGWNRKRIRNFITKEFSRHPEISAILRNTPLLFGENHAPLFAINIKPAGGLIKTR